MKCFKSSERWRIAGIRELHRALVAAR